MVIGGVKWHRNLGEVRFSLDNDTTADFQNIDMKVKPDALVADLGQITKLDGVTFWREDIPPMNVEQLEGGTTRWAENFDATVANTAIRVRVATLPAKSKIEFVMAYVTIRTKPPGAPPSPPNPNDPNYAIKLSAKDSKTGDAIEIWLINPNHTEALFSTPPTPKQISVEGKYTCQQIEREFGGQVAVQDIGGIAVSQVSKMQAGKQ